MKVVWAPAAERDRDDIWEAIALDSPLAAVRMDDLFVAATERVGAFPKLGRAGQISGTREWIVHESYRLVYEIKAHEDLIRVLAVVHTARQWPSESK